MAATTRASVHAPRTDAPDQVTPAEAAHLIRDHVTALEYALYRVRRAVGNNPDLEAALALADRQAQALTRLADVLHDPVK
jgi:hypothetical protein